MTQLTEKQFLIGLALKRFNEQYNRNVQISDCDIRSIPVRYAFVLSYEITSNRLDDNFRLHMHLRMEGSDGLGPYRVEVDSNLTQNAGTTGNTGDEVYVTLGTIDPYYRNQGIYKFRPLNQDPALSNILLLEDGTPLLLENGEEIELEVAM